MTLFKANGCNLRKERNLSCGIMVTEFVLRSFLKILCTMFCFLNLVHYLDKCVNLGGRGHTSFKYK